MRQVIVIAPAAALSSRTTNSPRAVLAWHLTFVKNKTVILLRQIKQGIRYQTDALYICIDNYSLYIISLGVAMQNLWNISHQSHQIIVYDKQCSDSLTWVTASLSKLYTISTHYGTWFWNSLGNHNCSNFRIAISGHSDRKFHLVILWILDRTMIQSFVSYDG